MPLTPGARFGSYEILAPLGAGGMGEVYRARDTRLGRAVAIKVLPADSAHDPEWLARFEREARVLAALHHPAIADIFGLESLDGHPALVMELVEGTTLAERIAAGPLPVRETIVVARQIAEALEAAHEKGIVHRDLKPANVKLSADGKAKVLDFGLATVARSDPGGPQDASQAPTLARTMTLPGVVLGTPGYMAPEQALGQATDRRADVWAFGVLLWEMLAGKRLFSAGTSGDTLAAVLQAEIDWSALPPGTPPSLRRLLRRCLQRDRRLRLRDIADAGLELDEALEELRGVAVGSGAVEAMSRGRAGLARYAAIAAAVLAVGVIAGALLGRSLAPRTANRPALRSQLVLPDSVRLDGWGSPIVALSRDGTKLAYVGHRSDEPARLYVHDLTAGRTQVVSGSETAEGPFFSPDGRSVAFAVGTSFGGISAPQLKSFSLASGLTQTLCDIGDYFGGTWGEDGTIYFVNRQPEGVFKVPAAGGKAEPVVGTFRVAREDSSRRAVAWPQLLPGGQRMLLIDWSAPRDNRAAVLDLRTRELEPLGIEADYVRYVPGGSLLYARRDQTLMTVGFDLGRGVTTGEPKAWMSGITTSGNEAAVFDLSEAGTFVYTRGYLRGSLRELLRALWLSADGALQPLPVEPAEFARFLRLSPDGGRVASCTWDGMVWAYDLRRGTRHKVFEGTETDSPVWSPDGRTIAFRDLAAGEWTLYTAPADGSAAPRAVFRFGSEMHPTDFTPDGSQILFYTFEPPGIHLVATDGGEPRQIASSGVWSALSPDGRWIAYADRDGGRLLPFVRRLHGSGRGVVVANTSVREPRWSRDGRELYYRTGNDIMAVSVGGTGDPEIGDPVRIATVPDMRNYDPAPGRREFVVLQRLPGSGIHTRLEVMTDGLSELKSLRVER